MANPRNTVMYVGSIPRSEKFKINYKEGDGKTTRSMLMATIEVRRAMKPKDAQYYPSDLFQFKVFGATADFIHRYVKRGDIISLVGENRKDDNYTKADGTIGYGGVTLYVESASIIHSNGDGAPVEATKQAQEEEEVPHFTF